MTLIPTRARQSFVLATLGALALVPSTAAAARTHHATRISAPASTPATVSPLNGTPDATAQTQISFLGARSADLSSIRVTGSKSGRHSGRLRSYRAVTGTSFVPSKAFTPGERVTVSARERVGRSTITVGTGFSVATPATIDLSGFPPVPGSPSDVQSFHTHPELSIPVLSVTQPATAATAPGLLLTTPSLGPGQHGPTIYDSAGALVWAHPLGGTAEAENLRMQSYNGKPVLTWWEGAINHYGFGQGTDVIVDGAYHTVAHVNAGNGMRTDGHEFTLTRQGLAIVMAYNPVAADLSAARGSAHGIALDSVVQEIDVRTGLVVWQWNSLGHVGYDESYSAAPGLVTNAFDYFHVNSAFDDGHGHLLIGARNTWAAYLVDVRTGRTVWRLGGKKSTFALAPGTQFAYQHDVEIQHNGLVTLFDDEGGPVVNGPTRAEVIRLDQHKRTATLVEQFLHTPPLQTFSQGNAQRLSNGNWMVGYGGLPNITEFNAQAQPVFDAHLPKGENSYRAYREQWTGRPRSHPAIAASTAPNGQVTVYASWNGATDVASWQVLAGASATSLTPVAKATRTGFETGVTLPGGVAKVQVRALSASGAVLPGGSSAVIDG